jgi:hypothetical protein
MDDDEVASEDIEDGDTLVRGAVNLGSGFFFVGQRRDKMYY